MIKRQESVALPGTGFSLGQEVEELVLSDGSEGEIWQDGQQVGQNPTVCRQKVGGNNEGVFHR